MRVILSSVVLGLLLGVVVGFGVGKFHAAQFPWNVELENRANDLFAEADQASADAADPANASDSNGKKTPRAKVGEDSFDFGIIEKNPSTEKGEHPFYIENVGDGDLELAEGAKGCFCTSFTISKKTLKPGEKATVLFKWDGARSGGVFNQGVMILTNDPNNKEIVFSVRGLYTSPVIAIPSELAFNNANSTSETTRTFRLFGFEHDENGNPFELAVENAELSDPERFTVEITKDSVENMTEEEKSNKLVHLATSVYNGSVTMKAGMTQGAFRELLRLRVNSPKTPIVEVPIHGSVMSHEIKVLGPLFDDKTSGTLRIDNVEKNKGAKTNLRLLVFEPIPVNKDTVFVKSVRPDWIKVDFTYPDEELQRVSKIRQIEANISIPPGSPEGAFMGPGKDQFGEIVFQVGVDEENAQTVVVPVRFAIVQ